MKLKMEIDLTPQEARKLMGLPDVEAMQEKVVDLLYNELSESIKGIKDPEKLWQRVMPMPQLDQLQKFIPDFGLKSSGSDSDDEKEK